MAKAIDHTGKRYGRLMAIRPIRQNKYGTMVWQCLCDCGNEVNVRGTDLTRGHTKSCGCSQREISRKNLTAQLTTHGLSRNRGKKTKLHSVWTAMRQRCNNPKNAPYSNYGGRGILVCPEWKNDYRNFYDWAMANGYKEGLSIDRINNNGNYEPDNCRWATWSEQSINKRTNRLVTYKGETKPAGEWGRIFGINSDVLYQRLSNGWPVERVLTEATKTRNTSVKHGQNEDLGK
jgi:hypothetical protein